MKYWVHGEHLNVDERKMSKSLGNIHTLRELLASGYSPLQIRYALLSVPYRTKLNFSLQSLDDARSALGRLESFVVRLGEVIGSEKSEPVPSTLSQAFLAEFESAMDDDMNTARALAALFVLVRDGNIALDEKSMSAPEAVAILAAIRNVDSVFDILPRQEADLDSEIEQLITARNEARKRRDFAESDRLRDVLLSKGIILEDTAQGTRWRRR